MDQKRKVNSKKEEETISNEEESELEQEIEKQEEIIEEDEFHEFIQSSPKSFSPVLEKIEIPKQESLEQNVSSVPIKETNDEEQIEYSSKYDESDYKSIEESREMNENLLVRPMSTDIERTGIRLHSTIKQDFQIAPELQELRRKSEGNLEEDYIVKAKKLNREDILPFEQRERKYKGKPI